MKLTQKTVAALDLPKGKSETIVFDEDLPGFGLRIRAGGKRTWVYQFKVGNQHRRMTLGSVTALSPQRRARLPASCTLKCASAVIQAPRKLICELGQRRRWPPFCQASSTISASV